jgi:2-oxoisovalerate dehydrogenase E1 component beta subunit
MRVRGTEQIPGEPPLTPEGEKQLKEMIDAPLGDRSAWKPKWPKLTDYTVELGKGKIVRSGEHVTVVTWGRLVPLAAQAADALLQEGYSVEVIDLRTIFPYDWEMISESIRKTRRVIYLNEELEVTNFGEHLLRRTVEEMFYELEARPRLHAGVHAPGVGLADALEMAMVPQLPSITEIIREVAQERA